MEKETYELLDTAIKIGLGALIAGVSAYFLSIRNLKNDLKKRTVEDKNLLIKEFAFKLEEIESSSNEVALCFINGDLTGAKRSMVPVNKAAYHSRAISNIIGDDNLFKDIEAICCITEDMFHALSVDQPNIETIKVLDKSLKEIKTKTYPHIRKAYNDLNA